MDSINALEEIGFSANEAKTYLALLEHGTMNGYNAAKYSGVSRTMIYDVLSRLVSKKCVNVIEAVPKLYCAVEYSELIKNMKADYNGKINDAEAVLAQAASATTANQYVFNVDGFDEMLAAAKQMIKDAEKELYISLWSQEAGLLCDELKDAQKRGVRIYVFSYCKMPFDFAIQYTYNLSDPQNLFPTRRLLIVADQSNMLVCENGDNAEKIGIITKNTMLIKLSVDQIVLDIINQKFLKKNGLVSDNMTAKEFIEKSDYYSREFGISKEIPFNKNVSDFLRGARKEK